MSDSARPSVLRFDHVTVRFEGTDVLADISFEASEGESRVILGAAGSGKTVMLKTSLGLIKPDAGKVFAFGRDLTVMKERELFEIRSKIGMLFQESALFDSLTIEENVAYPLLNQKSIHCPENEVQGRVDQALEFVELAGTQQKFPSALSGGMRRRAAIARAFVTRPPLIKERDLRHTTTLMVTHRYQDGNLIANFRYNSEQGRLEPARNGTGRSARTIFMVLREGRLIFEGDQDRLEAATDPYITKFVKQRV